MFYTISKRSSNSVDPKSLGGGYKGWWCNNLLVKLIKTLPPALPEVLVTWICWSTRSLFPPHSETLISLGPPDNPLLFYSR